MVGLSILKHLGRNYPKGLIGGQINVVMAAAAFTFESGCETFLAVFLDQHDQAHILLSRAENLEIDFFSIN